MFSVFRSSTILRFSTKKCLTCRNLSLGRIVHRASPLQRAMPIGMGLILGLGTGSMAFSQAGPHDDEDHTPAWKTWTSAALSKKEVRRIYKKINKMAPKRDIFKNLSFITPLFMNKCDEGKESMSIEQFFRWMQYHCNENFSVEEMNSYLKAFDLSSNKLIGLNEFIAVYVLVQTMEKKSLKKRDLFKWAKANFKAIDLDDSGYLDFDEVLCWIEFAIRAGYISNKCEKTQNLLTSEELADMTFRKYDENFDGKISFEEFRSIFSDLLAGHFTEPLDVSSSLRSF